MGSFYLSKPSGDKEIWFSLIRNGSWATTPEAGDICFEHGDDFISMFKDEVDDLGEETRDMLLQACGLVAT